ncbi:MAG: nucleotidyltransferase family protein [Rhodopila sp.]
MSRTIGLSPEALAIVQDVLRAHLPSGARAWIFGSRAIGTARRYSDLDLALGAVGPINEDALLNIRAALSESDLPFKVDVLDLAAVDPEFRALIKPDMVRLTY